MSHDKAGHCTLQHTRAFAPAGPRTRDGPLPPPRRREIQRLGDIRNIAGHDRERDPTEGEIEELTRRADKTGEDTLLRRWRLEPGTRFAIDQSPVARFGGRRTPRPRAEVAPTGESAGRAEVVVAEHAA